MSSSSEPDNRKAPRVLTDFVIELYRAGTKELLGIARLSDLSVTGAQLESTSYLSKDQAVTLRILLKRALLVTLEGQVRWSKQGAHTNQFGVEFLHCSEKDKGIIAKHVDEYFKKQ